VAKKAVWDYTVNGIGPRLRSGSSAAKLNMASTPLGPSRRRSAARASSAKPDRWEMKKQEFFSGLFIREISIPSTDNLSSW
jgi:hypothetical protein